MSAIGSDDEVEIPRFPRRRFYWALVESGGFGDDCYAAKCYLRNMTLTRCFLDDCKLHDCVLENCIITSGKWGETADCIFRNCIIRGTEHFNMILWGAKLENCSVEKGWDDVRTVRDREAGHNEKVLWKTFEDYSNVLLKECVVDTLRCWVWRCKRRWRAQKSTRAKQVAEKQDGTGMRKDSKGDKDNVEVEKSDTQNETDNFDDDDNSNPKATNPNDALDEDIDRDDIGEVWSAKKAGKRPFHVNDRYFVDAQLNLPLRRTEMWSWKMPLWKFDRKKALRELALAKSEGSGESRSGSLRERILGGFRG
jgi:hypothetical protein